MREILAILLLLAIIVAGVTKTSGKTLKHTCPNCGGFMSESRSPGYFFCDKCDEVLVVECPESK